MKGFYLAAATMMLSMSAYAVTASQNGTVSADGWLTVEDFQNKSVGGRHGIARTVTNPLQSVSWRMKKMSITLP